MANQLINHPTLGPIEFPSSMKDEEIVSAIKRLETDSQPAAVAASKPAPTEKPGWFQPGSVSEAAVRGASQGATLGFGDEIQAAIRAGGAKITGDSRPVTEIYKENRNTEREANASSAAANPVTYTATNIIGAAPALVATGAAGATVKGGAAIGATTGFGTAEGTAGEQLASTAIGAATGGAVSKVAPVAARYGSAVIKAVPPAVKAATSTAVKEAVEWSGATGGRKLLTTVGKSWRGEDITTPTLAEIIKPAIAHSTGPVGYTIAGAASVGKGAIEGAKVGSKAVAKELARTAPPAAAVDDVAKPMWAKIMDYIKRQPTAAGAPAETKTAQEIFKLNQTNPAARQVLAGTEVKPTGMSPPNVVKTPPPVPKATDPAMTAIKQLPTEQQKEALMKMLRERQANKAAVTTPTPTASTAPVAATAPTVVKPVLSDNPTIRNKQILDEIASRKGELGPRPVSFSMKGDNPNPLFGEKEYTITQLEDMAGVGTKRAPTLQADKDPTKVYQGKVLSLQRQIQMEKSEPRRNMLIRELEMFERNANK